MKKIGSIDLNMVESASSKILSIITARAGSKGLPNKNILPLNGKPVFEYTIDYSLELEKVYPIHTVVSTDSNTIIGYCNRNGIDFIRRNKKLSNDTARLEDVIYDAILKLNKEYKYISLLYADAPTRYTQEFKKAYDFLEANDDYDCAMSFKKVNEQPEYMYEYNESELYGFKTNSYRRQDIPKYMIHDGHTILFRYDYFKKFMEMGRKPSYLYEQFGSKIKPIILENLMSQINDMYEFRLAESIIGWNHGKD
jgi:CMP-N-acetylneuraminic acid synthetase